MSRKKSPQLAIVYRQIETLQPDPRNSNTHPQEQIEQLRASVREYGINKPILLKGDGKTIGAGHGVWEAAKLEGVKEVPTITIAGLSEEKWRAYAVADNRIARNSIWNLDVLTAELNALQGLGMDLGMLGFNNLELGTLGIDGFTLEERIQQAEITPPIPDKAFVKTGELWILGDHRLMIGDSTNAKDVARLFDGADPNLMATDPPYGVNYDPAWRNRVHRKDGSLVGGLAVGVVHNDHQDDWREAWALFPGNVAYVWHGSLHTAAVASSLVAGGFDLRSNIIWVKQQFAIGRGDYHWQHEPCWYAVRKGKPGGWTGDRRQTTRWDIDKPHKSELGHSTQKPIECMRRPILNNSKAGAWVYDPFSGTGTTIIACQMEKRRCLAMELDEIYAQVIIERWQNFSREKAVLDGDGRTFEVIRACRESGAGRKKGNAAPAAVEKSAFRKKRRSGNSPVSS